MPQGMGGSVLLRKYPAHVHTVYIADRNELADADTPEALAQLEALARQKLELYTALSSFGSSTFSRIATNAAGTMPDSPQISWKACGACARIPLLAPMP